MIIACHKYPKGLRKRASPKDFGFCPLCDKEVISKCGKIKIWHWAHKSNTDCDSFGEPETQWHLDWKNFFPINRQEVSIIKKIPINSPYQQSYELKKHRADILSKKGIVIELQNSPISYEEIEERENFYNKIIWIINGKTIGKNIWIKGYNKRYKTKTFKWDWFPKSWDASIKQIYIDRSHKKDDELLKITNFDSDGEGFCELTSKTAFIIEHGGKTW